MELNALAVELFKQFDPENKGYITQDQLVNGNNAGPFSDTQILSIFSLLDRENKGVITISDFTDAFLDTSKDLEEDDSIVFQGTNGRLSADEKWHSADSLDSIKTNEYDKIDAIEPRIGVNDYYSIDPKHLLSNDKSHRFKRFRSDSLSNQKTQILIEFKNARQWHSCDNHLNEISQQPNLSRTNSLDRSTCIKSKHRRTSSAAISKEFDSIFGQTFATTNGRSSSSGGSSCSDNVAPFSTSGSLEILDKEDYQQNNHNTFPRFVRLKDHDSTSNLKRHNSFSRRSKNVSLEELLSAHEEFHAEEWEDYLRRIGGVALFGGNQVLHYLWQQIGAYQKSLLLPLEDFLKSVIEEHKGICTKIQEVETTLHLKTEQHEKDIDNIYEEFERTTKEELLQLDKKQNEREETLKVEFRRAIESKEQMCQEHYRNFLQVNEKVQQYEDQIAYFTERNQKLEEHCRQMAKEQQMVGVTIETISSEKDDYQQKMTFYEENNKELNEYICQIQSKLGKEKEKHKSFIRRFKDLLEEKEFLEVSLSNLSCENIELKNAKKSAKNEKMNIDDFELDLNRFSEKILPSSSPRKTKIKHSKNDRTFNENDLIDNRHATLHEELLPITTVNRSANPKQGFEINNKSLTDELNRIAVNNKSLSDELEDQNNDSLDVKIDKILENTNIDKQPTTPMHVIYLSENDEGESLDSSFDNRMLDSDIDRTLDDIDGADFIDGTHDTSTVFSSTRDESNLSTLTLKGSLIEDSREETLEDSREDALDSCQSSLSCVRKIRLASPTQSEFKVIFCGDSCVGKTSLIHRLCFGKFTSVRSQTMQADQYTKIVPHGDYASVKLKLWDTCGQEKFNSLPRSYYRRSDVVVLVYDVVNDQSFLNAESWLESIHEYTDESTLIVLVGNKLDKVNKLDKTKKVDPELAFALAKENDAMFLETSAKSNENIDNLIDTITRILLDREETVIIQNDDIDTLTSCDLLERRKKHKINICC